MASSVTSSLETASLSKQANVINTSTNMREPKIFISELKKEEKKETQQTKQNTENKKYHKDLRQPEDLQKKMDHYPDEYQSHQQQEKVKKNAKSRKKRIKRPSKPKNPKVIKFDVSVQARNSMYSNSNQNMNKPLKNEASQVSDDGLRFLLPFSKQSNTNQSIGNELISEFPLKESEDELIVLPKRLPKEPDKKQCKYTIENVLITEFVLDEETIKKEQKMQMQLFVHSAKEKCENTIDNEVFNEFFDKSDNVIISEFYTDSYNLIESTNSIVFGISERSQSIEADSTSSLESSRKDNQQKSDEKQYRNKISGLLNEETVKENNQVKFTGCSEQKKDKKIDLQSNVVSVHPPNNPKYEIAPNYKPEKFESQSQKARNSDKLLNSYQPEKINFEDPSTKAKQSEKVEQTKASQKLFICPPKELPHSCTKHNPNECKTEKQSMKTDMNSKSDCTEDKIASVSILKEAERESEKAIKTEKFILAIPPELTTSIESEKKLKYELPKTSKKATLSLLDLEGYSESATNSQVQKINQSSNEKLKEKVELYNVNKPIQLNNIKQTSNIRVKQPDKRESIKTPDNLIELKERAKSETKTYKQAIKEEDFESKLKSPQKNQKQGTVIKAKSSISVHTPNAKIPNVYDQNIFNPSIGTKKLQLPVAPEENHTSEQESEKATKTEKFFLAVHPELTTCAESEQSEKVDKQKDHKKLDSKQPKSEIVSNHLLLNLEESSEELNSSTELTKKLENGQAAITKINQIEQVKPSQKSSRNQSTSLSVHMPKGQPQSCPRLCKYAAEERVASNYEITNANGKASLSLLDLEVLSESTINKDRATQSIKTKSENLVKLEPTNSSNNANNEIATQMHTIKQSDNTIEKSKVNLDLSKASNNINNTEKLAQIHNINQPTNSRAKQQEKLEPTKASNNINNVERNAQAQNVKQSISKIEKQPEKLETTKASNNINNVERNAQAQNVKQSINKIEKQQEKLEPTKALNNESNTLSNKQLINAKAKQPEKSELTKTSNNTSKVEKIKKTPNTIEKQPEKTESIEVLRKIYDTNKLEKSAQTPNNNQPTNSKAKQSEKTESTKSSNDTSQSVLVQTQKKQLQSEIRSFKRKIEEESNQEPKSIKKETKPNQNANIKTKSKFVVQDPKAKKQSHKNTNNSIISNTSKSTSSRFANNDSKNNIKISITVTLKDIGLEGLDSITPNRAITIRRLHQQKNDERKLMLQKEKQIAKLDEKSANLESVCKLDSSEAHHHVAEKEKPTTTTFNLAKDEKTCKKQISLLDSTKNVQKHQAIKIKSSAKNTLKCNKSNSGNHFNQGIECKQEARSPRRY